MNLKAEHIGATIATGIITWLIAIVFPFSPAPEVPEEYPKPLRIVNVDSLAALNTAIDDARPGDHIIVKNGAYESKQYILIQVEGTPANPIVIKSESEDAVEIRGEYGFGVNGSRNLIISGFKFTHSQDNSASTDNIVFMCNDCNGVRITHNTFALTSNYDGQADEELAGEFMADWLGVTGYSTGNRIDNNVFMQKNTKGAFLLLLGKEGRVVQNTLVDHNLFSGQLYQHGNGGECFRIGNSALGNAPGNMVMEYNTFEHCDGDREAITIKASNNIIRYNTFRNNEGSLTFRHGNANTADGNIFIDGNNGIRVYGHDHRIVNNYFANNPMTVSSLLAPIVIGKGTVENDLSTSNSEHSQPRNILIAHNTLVNNKAAIVIGYGSGSYAPTLITVANNIVTGSTGKMVTVYSGSSVEFSINLLYPTGSATLGDVPLSGYMNVNPQLVILDGMMVPSATSPAIDAVPEAEAFGVKTDIEAKVRTGMFDLGAYEIP